MSASTPLPLRVAIIGAGQVADKVHASYYATRSDVQMVAVMDSRLEQAQAFAERYAIPSAWRDDHAGHVAGSKTGCGERLFA
ncbi:MAG: Gfo/Idh/MocA family oxidoreductase [Enterobacter sp.]